MISTYAQSPTHPCTITYAPMHLCTVTYAPMNLCTCADWSCMPQGERDELGKVEFDVMLPNVNLLYLFFSVLVLLDRSYMSRFWYMHMCILVGVYTL